MYIYLNHLHDPADLAWPGAEILEVEPCSKIEGDTPFRSHMSHLPNHFGTHYDAPAHFHKGALTINELPIEYFVHKKVLVLDIPKDAEEGVMIEDLKPYEEEIKKATLLLIRTGFGKVRFSDPKKYQMSGPFLHPDTCLWMVKTFPDLLTVGFDFLAVGSPCNDLAAPAHQNLLGCHTDKFITACEDMKLCELDASKLKTVIMAPWRIAGLDSSQVTIIAELED